MKEQKRTYKYDGFVIITSIYFLAMLVASFVPFVLRTILSFIIHTPGLVETNGDASKLFYVVYPIVGTITLGGFLFAGWLAGYITGQRIAYETSALPNRLETKIHISIAGTLVFIVNAYFGIIGMFSGVFSIQFWYLSAVISAFFGVFDEQNLLTILSERDIFLNNFVIEGLTFYIIPALIIIAVLSSIGFVILTYKGLYKGSERGKAEREEFVKSLKENN